jgi:hypothetical protein
MQTVYFVLAAIHVAAVPVTGMMWTWIILVPTTDLRRHQRDIQAVHFGSLYLVPWFLGLSWAFERLRVPDMHQVAFPAGLGLLLVFASIGYLFPKPEGLDPFYYWTRGWAMVLALIGLGCAVVGLLWTAAVLTIYALAI